jgi:hypothetical protein
MVGIVGVCTRYYVLQSYNMSTGYRVGVCTRSKIHYIFIMYILKVSTGVPG